MKRTQPVSSEIQARTEAHRQWCAKWTVRALDGSSDVQRVMSDKEHKRTISGSFQELGWNAESGYPPVPRVGQHLAAMECTDGSWLLVVMSEGEMGLSEMTPGSPPHVSLFYAEPQS